MRRSIHAVAFTLLIVGVGLLASGCLPAGVVLGGTLTDSVGGGHPAGVPVAVYSSTANTLVAQTTTDATGTYGFQGSGLPDGTYRVLFSSADWWKDAASWATATDVVVTAAKPTTLSVTLSPAVGSLSGVVTDAGHAALSGVTVQAIIAGGSTALASTTTNGSGAYSFAALPAQAYVVRFSLAGYATTWSGGGFTPSGATSVGVTPSGSTTGVDATLAVQSTVAGRATDAAGTGIAGLTVTAYDHTSGVQLVQASTAADGSFVLSGLGPIAYGVGFVDPSGRLFPQIYVAGSTVGLGWTDPTSGSAVTPPAGGTSALGDVTQVRNNGVAAVSVGAQSVCATSAPSGATLQSLCLGSNQYGQVGNGDTSGTAVSAPFMLPFPGGQHLLSSSTGTATTRCAGWAGYGYCWGSNAYGQVGNGSTGAMVASPFELSLPFVSAISTNDDTTCAISNFNLYCWGRYAGGPVLGNGTTSDWAPHLVALADVSSVSVGAGTICAISNGRGYCWGQNTTGAVGNGDASHAAVTTPYELWMTGLQSITTTGQTTCATDLANAYCWGANDRGQVGNGDPTGATVNSPVLVGVANVRNVSLGGADTCVTTTGGAGYCWGDNTHGQVGNGAASGVAVRSPYLLPLSGLYRFSQDGAGTTTCVVGSVGWCWGRNDTAQVGNGSSSGADVPSPYALPLADVTTVSTVGGTTCAIAAGDGFCWGATGVSTLTSPAKLPL